MKIFADIFQRAPNNIGFGGVKDAAREGNPRCVRSASARAGGFRRRLRTGGKRASGFTLIITLSLLMMLVLLAVGLLSLATISMRSGMQGRNAEQARANARMALMLAIGELQKSTGADTRVTARADILDEKNPPILGVWKSWEGTDHATTGSYQGRPTSPGSYQDKKKDRFLKWLVSSPSKQTDSASPPSTGKGNGTVTLVGAETVGSGAQRDKLQVHLTPVEMEQKSGKGSYAWWVGGENQKARVPKTFQPDSPNPGRWSMLAKSHSVADPSVYRMDKLLKDSTAAQKTVSLQLADFTSEKKDLKASQEFFYDLSANSTGLLTNTATGGWRKDMSLLTENWTSVPNSNLPFFRLTPDKDLTYNKPTTGNPTPAKAMLYPWSSYRSTSEIAIYRQGAVASWENLKDYALLYRSSSLSTNASGRNRITATSVAIDGDPYKFIHRVRILPVVGRIQWVFSYSAVASGTGGAVEPRLLINPVITMWNPYNVEVALPSSTGGTSALTFNILKPLPPALRCTITGTAAGAYKTLIAGSLNYPASYSTASTLTYQIAAGFSLKPGETRIFSANTQSAATLPLTLRAGYYPSGGHYFPLLPIVNGKAGTAPSSATVKMDARFDTTYMDINPGVGIYMDMSVGDAARHLAYRMTYTQDMAAAVYKELPNMAEVSLSNAMSSPVPFMSTIFGARMASNTLIPSKGLVQSCPLVNYTAMGNKDLAETTIGRHYLGTRHPVNSPFDYSFVEHSTGGDDYLPNSSDATQRGYIVSGFNKSKGLSRCVIAEIPTRPIQSLGELQNWDMRYENPIPPYAFNLIGNSDATPLVPSNAVVDPTNASLSGNLQHDDSYCANHVLFDDWFFSSIAPDPDSYGSGGRNLQKTFTDFVSGNKDLANNAYKPIKEDLGASESDANQIYTDHVKTPDAWKNIASRLEVEGMFNVNSTSVNAWKALLGHARNQAVPYYQESGTSWSVTTSSETDYPVSRFAIAGDGEAGKSGSSGDFPGASQFTGYRVLDDTIIAQLAEEVVKQVRLRGPFLSLSEFVNRQLSSGDLALAGAIQTALNELAKKGGGPYGYLQGASLDASSSIVRASDAEYRFPQAAVGKSAYGLPGWTRQADILRPLAPILSARDDSFVVRAYGDVRDDDGKVLTSAVCEAVVKRTRNFVDATDAADLFTPPTTSLNKNFGRKYEIVSFRWLLPSEI